MFSLPPEKLKEILLEEGMLDETAFESVRAEAERKRQNMLDVLISHNLVSKDYFVTVLAKYLGVPRASISAQTIDEKILKLLPEDVARKRHAIVFNKEPDGRFSVAMEDPTDLETIDFLTLKLGSSPRLYLATEEDLNQAFLLYQEKIAQDFKTTIENIIQESVRSRAKEGDLSESAADLPIVQLVDNLLSYAFSSRASDIHFEILDDLVLVRFRIDGVLHEIIRMPKEIHPAVVARIKILSSLRIDEHTHPQDGRFRYKMGERYFDVRVSVIPTFYGEKIELRLLAAAQTPPSFTEIGMFEETAKLFEEAISKSYGMVLVCGPTGSGKTTTLYSVLNRLNRPEVNIVTVEDPIEYDVRYVNQVQVNVAAGITFSSGLRSILRQDPNIIMVGEVRDAETANIAVQAALTGHLVLSSLHTNDSPTAIPRLIDMDVPPFLVGAVLNMISSQRLARRVHLECIESYAPAPEIIRSVEEELRIILGESQAAKVKMPKVFYRGKGCALCNNTGYFGRIAIFEALNVTEKVRKLIVSPQFDLDSLRALAREEGMITMFEDGLKKAERGLTTIEELFRVIRE